MANRRRNLTVLVVSTLSMLFIGAVVQPPMRPMLVDPGVQVQTMSQAQRVCLDQIVDSVSSVRLWQADTTRLLVLSHRDSVFLRDCRLRYEAMGDLDNEVERLGSLHLAIPEYHDEQRFRLDATTFGPKVMIFASPNLQGFRDPDQVRQHGARGVLAAVVHVERPATGVNLSTEYTNLGLRPGVNCLWLSYLPPTGWAAMMSRAVPTDSTCRTDMPRHPLSVQFEAITSVPFDSIPPVARIEIDLDGRPSFGLKCLAGWCHIGPNAGFALHSMAKTAASGLGLGSAARLDGWHDEQILAEFVGGKAVPGRVRAALIPTETRYRSAAELQSTEGVRTAVLLLDRNPETSSRYWTWGLRRGRNDIILQYVPPTGGAEARYQVLLRSSAGVTTWTHVKLHEHWDAAVVPTARFRWVSMDDGAWFGCGQSCCRADGEM